MQFEQDRNEVILAEKHGFDIEIADYYLEEVRDYPTRTVPQSGACAT